VKPLDTDKARGLLDKLEHQSKTAWPRLLGVERDAILAEFRYAVAMLEKTLRTLQETAAADVSTWLGELMGAAKTPLNTAGAERALADLKEWAEGHWDFLPRRLHTHVNGVLRHAAERMRYVLALAKENVQAGGIPGPR
jgi:hypothetical protein